MFKRNKKNAEKIPYESKDRVLSEKTDFNTVETYKIIRTNIMFSMIRSEHGKVLCVTSAGAGEGKSTTTINLAITFAQMGARVVLLDCDMRKARVHSYLNIPKGEGLSNVLCGFTQYNNVLVKNVRENLDVITAGETPLNPVELLESSEFEKLVDTLKRQYDYVFIDTPPVTVVTDAAVTIRVCDGVVVVVRENVTTFDMMDDTMAMLKKAKTNILGVIMVGCEPKKSKYYYNEYKRKYAEDTLQEVSHT